MIYASSSVKFVSRHIVGLSVGFIAAVAGINCNSDDPSCYDPYGYYGGEYGDPGDYDDDKYRNRRRRDGGMDAGMDAASEVSPDAGH
jgi:hypothetical protein